MKKRLVSLVLGFLACLPLTSAADQDLQARFEKSLKDARSLTNVEIQMLDTSIYLTAPKETDFSSTFQYTYIASGRKFRATCKLVSATQTNTTKLSEVAFNGTSFVTYSADTRIMTRQDKIPRSDSGECSASPLIAPLLFLTKNSDECPTCVLRFSDIVSPDFARGLILQEGQQSNGLRHITMPGSPLGKKPTSWRIEIDESGESFTPQSVTTIIDAGMEIVWRLLNYTNVGGYQFPTRIEVAGSAYPPTSPPTLLSTETVTVISVRIPDRIPDSTFNLDDEEKSAVTVWDSGHEKIVKSPYDKLQANLRTQPNIYDESADGSKQIADALDLARKEHKQVLLQFGANWCGWCHKLHKVFETDKAIAEKLKTEFVVVMVDMNKDHNEDVDTEYGHPTRFGLPAIVILDTDGKPLTTKNTAELEEGERYNPKKVMAFLGEWSPTK